MRKGQGAITAFPITAILPVAFLFLLAAAPLHAQMVPGTRVIAESTELQLDREHQSKDFTVEEIACSVPGNVLWPGDQLTLTLRLTNTTNAPIAGPATIHAVQYGTRGAPGDIWKPLFYQIADVGAIPVQLNLAAHGSQEITIQPALPETFGGYLFFVELAGHGRKFAASVVRSMQPDGGAVRIPAYALDLQGSSDEVPQFFKRLGVKGARLGLDALASTDKNFDRRWSEIGHQLRNLQENEVTAMVTTGGGGEPMPLGQPRPHLTADGTFMDTKSDWSWLLSADPDFKSWVRKVCGTFGWPKGPINAFELWNEPWEGISISGWGADMLRYREIYTAMAGGIEEARAQDGTDVLIGGCGSSSNTADKLFPDGKDTFLQSLDFCSIHYQVMAATPALMRDFLGRKSPEGPVRTWDTESWIANSEDRIGLVVASMHAMGEERAMGVYSGNVYEPQSIVRAAGRRDTVVQAWSAAAAVGASTKFVGQRKFRELLFQHGLPWVFVFDGRPEKGDDDGTVMVAGDLSGCYSRDLLLFRTVSGLKNRPVVDQVRAQMDALPANAPEADRAALQAKLNQASILDGGSLTLSDGGGKFFVTDFYGNPLPAHSGRITVPLDGFGYYLRTDGSAGSFARLLAELRQARIDGYEPIEIIPHDFTARITAEPPLRLTLTNVLNRPITGKLSVRLGGADLAGVSVTLAANEVREVEVKAAGVASAGNNAYPMHAEFDAGVDGHAVHDETLHVNVISRRTITVDGNLDEWRDVIPQPLVPAGIGASLTEKAWLPFAKFDDSSATGVATGYAAYDDKNFYFAARVLCSGTDPGMARFATRDDDAYFYPSTSWRIDDKATFAKVDKIEENPDLKTQPLQLPVGEGRSSTAWESLSTSLGCDITVPAGSLTRVALYFLSWDPPGRHNLTLELSDPVTGKVFDHRAVTEARDGRYVVYNISGTVRVKIVSNNWLKAILNGIFFDPTPGAAPAAGNSAAFLRTDDRTRGDWKGVYGAAGCQIAGAPAQLSAGERVDFSTEVKKLPLPWPEGVRRFSYRQSPDLPAGGPENHDNVQIAFNVLPDDQKPWLASPPGTPAKWMMYWDTDYEYALNPVAPQYGGGTEIWRLQVPGMPRKHFYPRQPASPLDGPVKDGKLVIRRDGHTQIVEASIPWTEIPEVKKRLDAGQTIKFDFRVNHSAGPSQELATDRSVSKQNSTTFHNDWQVHWSNELEFGFEK